MPKHTSGALVPVEHIGQWIRLLRGQKVLLDSELAALYGVTTARLNQQVRRNRERFPEDFMFQLTAAEYAALMMQTATSKADRGGRRKLPLAFRLKSRGADQRWPNSRRDLIAAATFGGTRLSHSESPEAILLSTSGEWMFRYDSLMSVSCTMQRRSRRYP
jgi:hypothetical protein